MRKYLLLAAIAISAVCSHAQILQSEELEKYAKEKYGDKWTEAAQNLASQLTLDKNNALTYTQVIDCPGKTKEQLYVILNYWYSNTFNVADAVIQLNDKELGVIIGQGYVSNIASHIGGMNAYILNIRPIIKTDIKDEKIRVTYTVPFYDTNIAVGGGLLAGMSNTRAKLTHENWVIGKCFPFVEKDKHKRSSSKALVMAHAYSNVIMDKIEEVVKNGMVGNETEDW